jgi:hypothetical protein
MILEIYLSTRADRNYSSDHYYASPEEVQKGVYVDWMFPSQYREYVKEIYVKACADGEHVEVKSKYGSAKFSIHEENVWRSGSIGLSYACCEVSITFVPYLRERWDVLLATHGGATSMIARDEMKKGMNLSGLRPALDGTPMPGMDLEVCYMTHDRLGLYGGAGQTDFFYISLKEEPEQRPDVTLSLESYSTIITEWDEIEEKPVQCVVDTKDLEDSLTDPEAAMRVADAVAEQHPEMLELIAKYVGFAADLGNEDAVAWLRDYHDVDDSRYHAYD